MEWREEEGLLLLRRCLFRVLSGFSSRTHPRLDHVLVNKEKENEVWEDGKGSGVGCVPGNVP